MTSKQVIKNNQLRDPNNVLTTDFVYDKFGNMVEQRQIPDPDEPETYLATAFEYDCRGLMTQKTLPEGAITTLAYNAWGLKTEQIADAGGIAQKTNYGFDRLGRQTSITGYADSSTAQTTNYDLDKLGRVTTITYPDANSIAYEYYPLGTVKQRIDQRNLVTNYQYDHTGNLIEKTVTFDGANYEETFYYDGLGRMIQAEKYRGATHISTSEFDYNVFSKITDANEVILDADPVYISYEYDQLGNLTGITYPDANDVTITREALGRIDTISLDGDTIASYKYVGPRVKRRSYTNPSVTYDIDYNGLGQATRHHTYTTGTNIADFEYEYDDNGNIIKQEFNHRPSTPYNDYDYDDLDRLTEADYLVGVLTEDEQFTYDDLGNRTNVNLRSGDNESYSVNNLTNRYNSVGGNFLDYDEAGNLTEDPNGYEYKYDYENRLIEITKSPTTIAEYEYDALGRRIQKTDSVANETTRYYYDNEWRVLAEFDDNDTQLRDFIYGNYIDEVLVMTDSDEDQYYYAQDHIYSIVALIDENGNVVERYEYNAYGSPTIYNSDFSQTYDTSQYENPYFFTGRQMDSLGSNALRLGYNRNRYLDYYTGRWLIHDPLGITPNPQKPNRFNPVSQYQNNLNIYEYARSNAIIYTDLYGLWCGVVVKQQNVHIDEDQGVINLGHTWIEGCGISMGWWPKKDNAGLLEWYVGTLGEIPPSDPHARPGDYYDVIWTTRSKRKGNMKFGIKAGVSCKCVTCDDVCSCLKYIKKHTYGIWGMFSSKLFGHAIRDDEGGILYIGDCRTFADFAVSACCLKKNKPIKKKGYNK